MLARGRGGSPESRVSECCKADWTNRCRDLQDLGDALRCRRRVPPQTKQEQARPSRASDASQDYCYLFSHDASLLLLIPLRVFLPATPWLHTFCCSIEKDLNGHRFTVIERERAYTWRVSALHTRLHYRNSHPPFTYSDTSFKPDLDSQPVLKKRKISSTGAASTQPLQSSFADVLQRLKEEANETRGWCHLWTNVLTLTFKVDAEGGADAWARPSLPNIDPKRDSISKHSII